MEKFQNKYRIPSARLQNWDYGANGAYFITICTDKMQHFFGYVQDEKMHLNALGKIAHSVWEGIPKQFPYVELGNFQIMPNHMHGILIIDKKKVAIIAAMDDVETRLIASVPRIDGDNISRVDGEINGGINREIYGEINIENNSKIESDKKVGGCTGDHNPMLQENISRIIRWYKGSCSFGMRKIHAEFQWHSRFHDHIIRNSREFEIIQNYIEQNPAKWEADKFYNQKL